MLSAPLAAGRQFFGVARFPGVRRRAAVALIAAFFALAPAAALAHGSPQLSPGDLPASWTLEAQVIIPIGMLAWLYIAGVRAVWRRAGAGRGVRIWQAGAFAAALFALVIALVSPLDAASDAVFTAHMLQHSLLVLIVPPLLVLSAPAIAFAWALPPEAHPVLHAAQRSRPVATLSAFVLHPVFVWAQFALVFWAWHVPALYDAAVRHDTLHGFEHLSLLASSLLFWWLVLKHAGRRAFPYPAAVAFVFTAMLQMMIVPVLLSFSGSAWYAYYGGINPAWHLTPVQDQRIGGLTMWMISNAIFIVLGGYLVVRWLLEDERREEAELRRRAGVSAREPKRSWMSP